MTSFSCARKPGPRWLMPKDSCHGYISPLVLLHAQRHQDYCCQAVSTKLNCWISAVATAIQCFLQDIAWKGAVVCISGVGVQKWPILQAAKFGRPFVPTCSTHIGTSGAKSYKAGKLQNVL